MYRFLLLSASLLLTTLSFAGNFNGTVSEEKNGSPLVGVIVTLKGTDKGGVTDIDGKYEITGVKAGSYDLEFRYINFVTETRKVVVKGNETQTFDVKMKEDIKELKATEIVAKKITHTEMAVINEIKASNAVVSGTSASQISKTMDRNAADVVKRIPGVAIQDDRFIVVRGLADRYNTVWLNDAGAPSSETDKRSFSFDIIPSGLIDRIMVFKTPSAELPGDFAGGMVKVYTTSLQDKNSISVNLQTSSRQYTTGQDFNFNTPSSTDWLGYDNGDRSLPGSVPARLNKATNMEASKDFNNDWGYNTQKASPDARFALGMSGVKKFNKVTIGGTFGLSYSNIRMNTYADRQDWDSNVTRFYYYKDTISTRSNSIGLLANGGISFGTNKIEFKNLYSQVGKSSFLYRNAVADSANPPEQTYVMGYESKATYASQLSGSHKSKNDDTKYNWTLGYSDVFKNTPDLRRLRYVYNPIDSNMLAAVASGVDPVSGGGRTYSQLYEHMYSFSHQFSKKIHVSDKFTFTLNAGNYVEYKSRAFNLRWFSYTLSTIKNPNAAWIKALPIDQIFADSNVGVNNRYLLDEGTNTSDKYSGTNMMLASFVSFNIPIGDKINVVAGLRDEENTFSLKSYYSTDTIKSDIKTSYFLPSINATYNFNPKSLVRFAYGKTLNRPEFRESAPTGYYDFDEIAFVVGARNPTITNPKGRTLSTAEIQNLDIRYELYPSSGEIIHAGVFYKSIYNSIQRVIDFGKTGENKTLTYLNGDMAYVVGFELDIRKNLAKLDKVFGTKEFQNFTFVGNLALSKSELKVDTTVYTGQMDKTNLQGQSPYVINMGLYYQKDEWGMKGSVLYNVYGPRLYAAGNIGRGGESIGELPFNSLDVTLSKVFFKHYSLNVGVQNLLDSKIRFVKDINRDNKFSEKDGDLSYRSYKPGRYFTIGVKINF